MFTETLIAAGEINFPHGGANVSTVFGATIGSTAAGIKTVTLDQAVDSAECVVSLAIDNANAEHTSIGFVHTSDTVKTITMWGTDNHTALDTPVSIRIARINHGN